MDTEKKIKKLLKVIGKIGIDSQDPRILSIIEELLGAVKETFTLVKGFSIGDRVWSCSKFENPRRIRIGEVIGFRSSTVAILKDEEGSYAQDICHIHPFNYEMSLRCYRGKNLESGDRVYLAYPIECHHKHYLIVGFSGIFDVIATLYNPKDNSIVTEPVENLRHY